MADAVLGLDLSERCSGAVVLLPGWLDGGVIDWLRVRPATFVTPKASCRKARIEAYRETARRVRKWSTELGVTVVGIETPLFRGGRTWHRLSTLNDIVYERIAQECSDIRDDLSTSAIRKTLLGQVPKRDPKSHVQAHLKELGCPWWNEGKDGDAADAFAVANHAASLAGLPFITVRATT